MQIHKILTDIAPPSISAKSWAIIDAKTGDILFGKNENEPREIASLTKIMTAFIVIQIVKVSALDPKETLITVSKNAASITGTSARLKGGDVFSIWDILHGLMLPSGNDAAVCLAEHFGQYLYDTYGFSKKHAGGKQTNHPLKYFVQEMNRYAQILGLNNTSYTNPHGLAISCNKSTASDIGRLSAIAMQEPLIREIVKCANYTCSSYLNRIKEETVMSHDEISTIISSSDIINRSIIEEDVKKLKKNRVLNWENTNKLLDKGFNGLKTGITSTAGPCLSASFVNEPLHLIVVILASKSTEIRWSEVSKLTLWSINRINRLNEYFSNQEEEINKAKSIKKIKNT